MADGDVIELNVNGVTYATSRGTLKAIPESNLYALFNGEMVELPKVDGQYAIKRDGYLFRFILDYLRTKEVILPENFTQHEMLKHEAEYFLLSDMVSKIQLSQKSLSSRMKSLSVQKNKKIDKQATGNTITVGYRGTFSHGKESQAGAIKFRKLTRIYVAGKLSMCQKVFGETLNESRDHDKHDTERYTSRFFLNHSYLEKAFDDLLGAGYQLMAACGSGTNSAPSVGIQRGMSTEVPDISEEAKWYHYNEFVWVKN